MALLDSIDLNIDLNIDLGELDGEPDELYALATVANVACGGHAGDASSMSRAIDLARRYGTRIAAHPSYPDRKHFGRMHVAMRPDELRRAIAAQCTELRDLARARGTSVEAVKAHGALYHDVAADPAAAAALLDAAAAVFPNGVTIVGPPEGALAQSATSRGFRYAREGFADRRYGPDGRLIPREMPGAVLDDPAACARQALALAARGSFDTLCVHGDNPRARDVAHAVRRALDSLAPTGDKRRAPDPLPAIPTVDRSAAQPLDRLLGDAGEGREPPR